MSLPLERARVWLEQGRHDRAEGELRQALVEEPGNPHAHALLSLTLSALERAPEATEEARTAIASAPDYALAHYALALALHERGRLDEARTVLDEVLRLDPHDPDAWALEGQIYLGQRNWDEAGRSAERALAIDAEHLGAINIRARALEQSGRRIDAEVGLATAVARDPQNAFTHANVGWARLQRGELDRALEHFQEALRLEPGQESARSGLIETIKARNPFYRALLSFFFWMGRQRTRTVWIVVILSWLAPKVLRSLAKTFPVLTPVAVPLAVVVAGFALLTWVVEPLSNALLLFHPVGRHALNRLERLDAYVMVGCIATAAAFIGMGIALHSVIAIVAGSMCLLIALPVTGSLGLPNAKRRRLALCMTAALAAVALLAAPAALFGGSVGQPVAAILAAIFFLGVFAMTWLLNFWRLDPRTD